MSKATMEEVINDEADAIIALIDKTPSNTFDTLAEIKECALKIKRQLEEGDSGHERV